MAPELPRPPRRGHHRSEVTFSSKQKPPAPIPWAEQWYRTIFRGMVERTIPLYVATRATLEDMSIEAEWFITNNEADMTYEMETAWRWDSRCRKELHRFQDALESNVLPLDMHKYVRCVDDYSECVKSFQEVLETAKEELRQRKAEKRGQMAAEATADEGESAGAPAATEHKTLSGSISDTFKDADGDKAHTTETWKPRVTTESDPDTTKRKLADSRGQRLKSQSSHPSVAAVHQTSAASRAVAITESMALVPQHTEADRTPTKTAQKGAVAVAESMAPVPQHAQAERPSSQAEQKGAAVIAESMAPGPEGSTREEQLPEKAVIDVPGESMAELEK